MLPDDLEDKQMLERETAVVNLLNSMLSIEPKPKVKTPLELAVQHGSLLADAADNYLAAMHQVLTQDLDPETSTKIMHQARSNLELKVFEFRKITARA